MEHGFFIVNISDKNWDKIKMELDDYFGPDIDWNDDVLEIELIMPEEVYRSSPLFDFINSSMNHEEEKEEKEDRVLEMKLYQPSSMYLRSVRDLLDTYLRSMVFLHHEYVKSQHQMCSAYIRYILAEITTLHRKKIKLFHDITSRMPLWRQLNPEEAQVFHQLLETRGKWFESLIPSPERKMTGSETPRYGYLTPTKHPGNTIGMAKLLLEFFCLMTLLLTAAGLDDSNYRSSLPSPEFQWLSNETVIEGLYKDDVQVEWKYKYNEKINSIHITRSGSKQEDVATWTSAEGPTPSPFLSTDVTLEHRKEGDVGSIILTLIRAYPVDFDKQYKCEVFINAYKYTKTIEVKEIKLGLQPVNGVVDGRPGQNIKLIWMCNYPLPVATLVFKNDRNTETEMAFKTYWGNDRTLNSEVEYKHRLRFGEKQKKSGKREITLTLLNTTIEDFNHTYRCHAFAENGILNSSSIYLSVEEEEEKPGIKTVSTQLSSSVSGLSKDPVFQVYFIWLLAERISIYI